MKKKFKKLFLPSIFDAKKFKCAKCGKTVESASQPSQANCPAGNMCVWLSYGAGCC